MSVLISPRKECEGSKLDLKFVIPWEIKSFDEVSSTDEKFEDTSRMPSL